MKFGILNIFINTSCNTNRANGLEIYYLRKALLEAGHEVSVIGHKNVRNADQEYYVDANEAEWETYDGIFIQLAKDNFFGGGLKPHTVAVVEGIAKAKNKIYNLATDPMFPPINPARALARFNLCQDYVDVWDDLIEDSIQIFPGKDIAKFNGWKKGNVLNFNLFGYIFKNLFTEREQANPTLFYAEDTKKWDVIYFGRNRKSYRESMLVKYMPKDTRNLLVGYKTRKVTSTQINPVSHDEMMYLVNQSKVSLIIGDQEHLDNVVTYRFYETLASNSLAAIQIEYDPNKELIQDTVLRKVLYVENAEDVKVLTKLYSKDLLDRQKRELARIFSEINKPIEL